MEFSNVKRNPPVKEGKAQLVKKEGNRKGIEGPKSSDPKASELQTSMIQIMEAVEREKQKHNSTMMEAIAWLAELEAKMLEGNLDMMQGDVMHPSDVEIELKKRLDQLTDRLIQKQTQVILCL
ncbi:golgin candidate 2-like [Curcuma longa]|uniref:golgin candidate 2-like n=1 Tax=Curcuma longa TaxID=136217 RepID=UPI003D9F12B3